MNLTMPTVRVEVENLRHYMVAALGRAFHDQASGIEKAVDDAFAALDVERLIREELVRLMPEIIKSAVDCYEVRSAIRDHVIQSMRRAP